MDKKRISLGLLFSEDARIVILENRKFSFRDCEKMFFTAIGGHVNDSETFMDALNTHPNIKWIISLALNKIGLCSVE